MDGGPVFTWDAGFLPWLERWLDEFIGGWEDNDFKDSMPGSSDRLWEIIHSAKVTLAKLKAVLLAYRRCPYFEARLAPVVAEAFSHFSEEVRMTACEVVRRHKLTTLEKYIFQQLDDPHPGVVAGALLTMTEFPVSQWEAKARLLLNQNGELAFQAGCLLSDVRSMTKADLFPLIDSNSADQRRSGIYFWGRCGFHISDAEWLERRRLDESLEVRREIILAAIEAKDHQALPVIRQMAQDNVFGFEELPDYVRVWLLQPTSKALPSGLNGETEKSVKSVIPMWKTLPIWLAALIISFFVPPQALLPLWGVALLTSIALRIWY